MSPASAGPIPQLELDRGFIVGSGIECSAPIIAGGHRQDELIKTGHWTNVDQDLRLVAEFFGLGRHLRERDARFVDEALTARAAATDMHASGIAWTRTDASDAPRSS